MSGMLPLGTDLARVLAEGRMSWTGLGSADAWLNDIRRRGADAVGELPVPERRQEAWRYTSTAFLQQTDFRLEAAQTFDALQESDIEEILLPDEDIERLVLVNGRLAPDLCACTPDTGSVTIRSLGGGLGDIPQSLREHLDALVRDRHIFAALNTALMSDGALIQVRGSNAEERPIELLHIAVGLEEPVIRHPRHLLVLEDKACARIIERYASIGKGVYFNNALIEVALGTNSELTHSRVQEESPEAQHLSDLHIRLGRDSRYRSTQISLGAAWSRTDLHLAFAGEGAQAELNGLMLAGDSQLSDVHLDIDHAVPQCTSRETFKGILDGKGRVVFDGRIRVARDAQKTDANLSNDNLLLSRSAEVDSKPQLEILADDVKCSHGTTVGELDPDMLFYLQSRAIEPAKARQMLALGFADQIVEAMENPALRSRAQRLLADRLLQQPQAQQHSAAGELK
jgi:Fe-S cluster assembly protein SufD